jgi:hypothetical protein
LLYIWDAGAISGLTGLTSILSADVASYDEACGGLTTGINELPAELIAPGITRR